MDGEGGLVMGLGWVGLVDLRDLEAERSSTVLGSPLALGSTY